MRIAKWISMMDNSRKIQYTIAAKSNVLESKYWVLYATYKIAKIKGPKALDMGKEKHNIIENKKEIDMNSTCQYWKDFLFNKSNRNALRMTM